MKIDNKTAVLWICLVSSLVSLVKVYAVQGFAKSIDPDVWEAKRQAWFSAGLFGFFSLVIAVILLIATAVVIVSLVSDWQSKRAARS